MECEHEREPDPMAAKRRWQQYLSDVDAEIREEQSAEYQAEQAAEAARRERWRNLPPVRLRPGVRGHRLSEQEQALLDRSGY